MPPAPDTLTAILAALGGSVCAILAFRTPTGAHITNVRAVERDILALRQAAERRARRRRRIWLAVILAGALLLLALALTDTASAAPAAACRTIVNAPATVTNISRLPAGRFEIAVRLTGSRTVASIVTTRRFYLRQLALVSGQLCAEGRIEGASLK